MKVRILSLCLALAFTPVFAQIQEAPDREQGEGPYTQLIIRGVTLINGNGAPPMGPVDIVIEGNRITQIRNVGYPGVEISENRRPKLKEGGKELDAEGQYVLPGFVDMHGHIGGTSQGTPSEYVFKLWMAHGITTVRDPSAGNGLKWVLNHKERSAKNEITAPRILAYTSFGQNLNDVEVVRTTGGKNPSEKLSGPISTADEARSWVQANFRRGADGIKFFGASPDVMDAALKENKRLGLRSACHHAQLNVAWWNVVNSAEAGLTSMEHWYGLPEAMFTDRVVQDYPADYNYQNEQDRFGEAGRLWQQAAPPYSEKWNEVMNHLISLDFTLDPTFNIYEASRDLMRARRAEWHEDYTLPSLWEFYKPSKISHGSYWHFWSTEKEVEWKKNYKLWMTFVNEYKNRGGRVTTGSDSGFIYQLYGFAYVRELELLQEAGFHPLEVIRSATLMGAQALGMDDQIGTIEIGKLADLVIVEENPLVNLKSLYGTGAIKLTEENEIIRAGGVKYTIKDGIIYDAKSLLADVRKIVEEAKKEAGIDELSNPGYPNWNE
ncbi:MAG: amidohydrolase family protein [Cyclobacteriaceae bacterium]